MKRKGKFITTAIALSALLSTVAGCGKVDSDSSHDSVAPYETSGTTVQLKVDSDEISDLLPLEHKSRSYVYLKEKSDDSTDQRSDYYENLDTVAEIEDINISDAKTLYAATALRDKIIVEMASENENEKTVGAFDAYTNTYEEIGTIPFSAGYGKNTLTVQDRYYVSINTVNEVEKLKGSVTVYNIVNGSMEAVDSFDAANVVNGVTAVGENAIAYFYYETDTQDWIVKHYDFTTGKAVEIFRHTNSNKNKTASVMAIGSDGKDIVLAVQYVENGVYFTNLEWISSDGKWNKTEVVDFSPVFGDEYEINSIAVSGDVYCVDAYVKKRDTDIVTLLKRENDTFRICSMNTLTAKELVSSASDGSAELVFTNYAYEYDVDKGIEKLSGIDGISEINASAYEMKSFEFSENISLDDRVILNAEGDIVIIYSEEGVPCEYQLIENFTSIDVKTLDGGIPVYPGEFSKETAELYKERDFYYDNE